VCKEVASNLNETKKLLDKSHQPHYHRVEGIQLSSSVQIKRQEYYGWRLMFNFLHCVHLMSLLILPRFLGFSLYKLKRAYKSFKTV
jgi:hypothetical protein